jgi:PAS domain S-box-containing protein
MLSRIIQDTEEKFVATFNQAAVGIAHVGLDGSWLRVNDRLCKTLGYSREEFLKIRFQDISHPEDLESDLTQLRLLIAGKIPNYSIEKRYIHKNKTEVWANLTVSMVTMMNPRENYFISVVEDISARKKAEADMASMQAQLKKLLDERTLEKVTVEQEFLSFFMMSSDVMVVFSPEGFARRLNRAAIDLLGKPHVDLHSLSWSDFIDSEDLAAHFMGSQLMEGGDTITGIENRYVGTNESVRYLSWSVTFIPESKMCFALGRDVTDERNKEKIVAEEKVRLASVSKMNSLGRMAANIAHEINNPLTVIYGQACYLLEMCENNDVENRKVHKIADDIATMSDRITTIIRGLRMFAREGSQDAKETKTVESIVSDTLALCKNHVRMGGVELDVSGIEGEILVDCRTVQISQVILNLINNAFDAVQYQTHKKIWLRTKIVGELCQISVVDSGPGLDAASAANLFQPFFTTKPIGKGTGLGLSIARQIIEGHQGRLFYRQEDGCTSFVIELPTANPPKSILFKS